MGTSSGFTIRRLTNEAVRVRGSSRFNWVYSNSDLIFMDGIIMNMNESILRTAKDSVKGLPLHYQEELAILEAEALNVNEDTIMEWLENMYQFISDCDIHTLVKK